MYEETKFYHELRKLIFMLEQVGLLLGYIHFTTSLFKSDFCSDQIYLC